MTLKEAMKRIEELERKVKELESRPQHLHFHNSLMPPTYISCIPQPYPLWPTTYAPYLPIGPTWTAGADGQAGCGNLPVIFNT